MTVYVEISICPISKFFFMGPREINENYHVTIEVEQKKCYLNRYILTGEKDDIIRVLKEFWRMGTVEKAEDLLDFEDRVKLGLDKLENN